ncbi:MAG: hypothetical protein MH204_10595, partial [Fimbriimonadaceae bacterium]|nr:hypothetical protein [Fimbriimonadaceae bacterium]
MLKRALASFAGLAVALAVWAQAPLKSEPQGDENAQFTARLAPADARAGEGAQIVVEAKVSEGWYLYAPSKEADFQEL